MATIRNSKTHKPGWLPGVSALLAFIACNGLFIIVGIFALFGVTIVINPHIQGAIITLFSVLTLAFVIMNYRNNKVPGPVVLSAIGTAIIAGSMYIYFNKTIESIGLIILFTSAIWSWRACRTSAQLSSNN